MDVPVTKKTFTQHYSQIKFNFSSSIKKLSLIIITTDKK